MVESLVCWLNPPPSMDIQDSLDLFVGNHSVSPTEGVTHESPLAPLQPDQR